MHPSLHVILYTHSVLHVPMPWCTTILIYTKTFASVYCPSTIHPVNPTQIPLHKTYKRLTTWYCWWVFQKYDHILRFLKILFWRKLLHLCLAAPKILSGNYSDSSKKLVGSIFSDFCQTIFQIQNFLDRRNFQALGVSKSTKFLSAMNLIVWFLYHSSFKEKYPFPARMAHLVVHWQGSGWLQFKPWRGEKIQNLSLLSSDLDSSEQINIKLSEYDCCIFQPAFGCCALVKIINPTKTSQLKTLKP